MNWLKGYIYCKVKTGNWERFMNLCRHHNIRLWNVRKRDNSILFCMYIKDYKEVVAFVRKTHVIPNVCERRGLPFVCWKALQDWTFSIGVILFFVLLKVLSMFIWQINYEGQQEYTKESINREVVRMGVSPGMLRRKLDCDRIERNLREIYDNISWVSAEENGCVLNIKIKEGTLRRQTNTQEEAASHLVAPCDGVIQGIVTKEGTPQVKKGDSVKEGDVLIRGVVEVTDDSDTVVACHGVCASGEIQLEGSFSYEDSINLRHVEKTKTGKNIHVYVLEGNGHRISFKNPLKWFDKSGNYDIINYVCVDRDIIPVGLHYRLTRRTYINYTKKTAVYGGKEAEDLLKGRFASRLAEYVEKGYEVSDSGLYIEKQSDRYVAEGHTKVLIKEMEKQLVKEEELLIRTIGKEDEVGNNS